MTYNRGKLHWIFWFSLIMQFIIRYCILCIRRRSVTNWQAYRQAGVHTIGCVQCVAVGLLWYGHGPRYLQACLWRGESAGGGECGGWRERARCMQPLPWCSLRMSSVSLRACITAVCTAAVAVYYCSHSITVCSCDVWMSVVKSFLSERKFSVCSALLVSEK